MVVTIAAPESSERAFSADTGMAEALIVATKRQDRNGSAVPILFVNLRRRPASLLEAAETAQLAARLPKASASGRFRAGGQLLGTYIRAPLAEGGCAALREPALAETMIALRRGELRMPRRARRDAMPIAPLGELGERGLLDRDVGGVKEGKPPFREPFRVVPIHDVPNYPILWAHDADRERTLIVEPDSEGEARPGREDRAIAAWRTATRLHFTLDFRLNSQSLAACLTPEPALGGRAWPNFRLHDADWEECLALWANGTLGLMAFWWAGSRQQQGRSVLTITGLPELMALDVRALPREKLARARAIFRRFRGRPLLPANEAWRDRARQALDRALLVELLDLPEDVLGPLDNLRLQWCNEPSVHGGKPTSPGGGKDATHPV